MASYGMWITHIGGFCRETRRVPSLLIGLYNRDTRWARVQRAG
jgi:hypothetical protein